MNREDLFVEIGCRQVNCRGERLCGDRFLHRTLSSEDRTVMILSDGMGHGVKANVLSTLTASVFLGMAGSGLDVGEVARTVIKTLPVCNVRKLSYSTFTLVNIEHRSGEVEIVQYDNPPAMLFRRGELRPLDWQRIAYEEPHPGTLRTLVSARFAMQEGDRIVLASDGVTQSGLGSDRYPFGWGEAAFGRFVGQTLADDPDGEAEALADAILTRALDNDAGIPHDDITVAVVRLRRPRKLLLCSCPPSLTSDNRILADYLRGFEGVKLICGYPMAMLVANEWGVPIRKNLTSTDPEVPPEWNIDGVDLVTEGLTTLSKVLEILEHYADMPTGRGAAYHVCTRLLASDRIEMWIGMRGAGSDLSQSESLMLRRKVLASIAKTLEKKFAKQVAINYL